LQADVSDLTRARKRMREQEAEINRTRTELEQEHHALASAQAELAELRSSHAGTDLAEKLDEKDKAINTLSGALRNRDATVARLTRRLEELKQRYADLEHQYVKTNPTMPNLAALPEKEAGSGRRD